MADLNNLRHYLTKKIDNPTSIRIAGLVPDPKAKKAPKPRKIATKIPAGFDRWRDGRKRKARKKDRTEGVIEVGKEVEHNATATGDVAEVWARFELHLRPPKELPKTFPDLGPLIPAWERDECRSRLKPKLKKSLGKKIPAGRIT